MNIANIIEDGGNLLINWISILSKFISALPMGEFLLLAAGILSVVGIFKWRGISLQESTLAWMILGILVYLLLKCAGGM